MVAVIAAGDDERMFVLAIRERLRVRVPNGEQGDWLKELSYSRLSGKQSGWFEGKQAAHY